MAGRLRIPGLIDIVRVRSPGEILESADHPALARGARIAGPFLNRLILRRVRRGLRTRTAPLPSALPRDDAARADQQRALAERLDPGRLPAPWDEASLDALAQWVQRRARRPLGQLAQEAVGRLFDPDYQATRKTWAAARTLDLSLRSNNPIRRLWLLVTNGVARAQRTLTQAVGGDTAGVHATGVAVHTFARAIERLGEAHSDRRLRDTLSTRAVLGRSLTAPDAVLRQVVYAAETPAGAVEPGTLVIFETATATAQSADRRVAFLSESWSFCPAHALVPALLAEIWQRATGETLEPDGSAGPADRVQGGER